MNAALQQLEPVVLRSKYTVNLQWTGRAFYLHINRREPYWSTKIMYQLPLYHKVFEKRYSQSLSISSVTTVRTYSSSINTEMTLWGQQWRFHVDKFSRTTGSSCMIDLSGSENWHLTVRIGWSGAAAIAARVITEISSLRRQRKMFGACFDPGFFLRTTYSQQQCCVLWQGQIRCNFVHEHIHKHFSLGLFQVALFSNLMVQCSLTQVDCCNLIVKKEGRIIPTFVAWFRYANHWRQ